MLINRNAAASRPRGRPTALSVAVMIIAAGLLAVLAMTVSVVAAGVLFAIGLGIVAVTRPALAMVFVWGAAPFIWDVGGGPVKMAVSEFALVVVFLSFAFTHRFRRTRNPLWLPIGSYFIVCVLSLALNGLGEGAVSSMIQMMVYMVMAVWVFSAAVRDPQEVLPALYAYVCGSLVLVAMLVFAGSNYAFGIHKNNMGACLGLSLVAAVGLWMGEPVRRWKRLLMCAVVALLAGLIFTLSRGAWVGAITGAVVMQLLRRQWKQAMRMLALLVPIAAIVWVMLPSESKEYATGLDAEKWNIKARYQSVDYAMSQFKRHPLIGVGAGLRKTYDATNIILSTMAETGALGLIAFLSIFVVFAMTVWRASLRLNVQDPAMVLLTVGAGLMADKLVHGFVDHYWVRGILPVWAGAGLAICAANRAAARQVSRAAVAAGTGAIPALPMPQHVEGRG